MIALALALVLAGADAGADAGPELGTVLRVDRVSVDLEDGGVLELAPAIVLDETAGLRLARELAADRAEEPILRSTPAQVPGWVVVIIAGAAGLAYAGGIVSGWQLRGELSK